MTRSATTLEAVAARAGVHAATVSRVLSRPELVKPETRMRVQSAIDELDYVPNRAARELAGGATGMVALLVPDITNPYFASVVQAAQRRLHDGAMLAAVADTSLSAAEEQRLIESLAPNVDGIIVCSPVSASGALTKALGKRRTVLVNRRVRGLSSVAVEQGDIVAAGADHLRSLGHERIVTLSGPASYWSTRQRSRAEAEIGIEPGSLGSFAPSFEGGVSAVQPVLDSSASGVLAFNDAQALGLISGLAASGTDVPAQVSVVGSDDVPYAAMSNPALTTVAAPLEKLGTIAVDLLAAEGSDPVAERLNVDLVRRASTGPAA